MIYTNRILSVDYGDARTGIAVSDMSHLIANGVCTIKAEGDRGLIKKIQEIINQYGNIELIIVGNPLNMDGSKGPRSEKAEAFAKKIEKSTGIAVQMVDERCTTVEAYDIMDFTQTHGKKRKAAVDTLAAEIILQDYLSLQSNSSSK